MEIRKTFVVASGPGYVANPKTLEMVCDTDRAAALRLAAHFIDRSRAEAFAEDVRASGCDAMVVEVSFPGLEILAAPTARQSQTEGNRAEGESFAPDTRGEYCATCYFWRADYVPLDMMSQGTCRLSPDTRRKDADHWCGEWQPSARLQAADDESK